MTAFAATADVVSGWFALAGTLGGGLLTGTVGFVTVILNQRWQARNEDRRLLNERTTQLRQERREAYLGYWSTWDRLYHEIQALYDELLSSPQHVSPEVVERMHVAELAWREAANALFLIGGADVAEAAVAHLTATELRMRRTWERQDPSGARDTAYHGLHEAMRGELLTPPAIARR
ncbi:hypothetical protein ACQPYK_44510 [Streptosporangium sp. CA-135522]|uniref:hypothetical protein n=1 Tax=Streptosporangium sp. CA-135522 TaxID=3240072 RepID=UPI003D8BD43D